MSRVGRKIITVPPGVKVKMRDDLVEVEGPKGTVVNRIPAGIRFELNDGQLTAVRSSETKEQKALHGLARSLVANAVKGVTQGFQKELEIHGIGFRAELR